MPVVSNNQEHLNTESSHALWKTISRDICLNDMYLWVRGGLRVCMTYCKLYSKHDSSSGGDVGEKVLYKTNIPI